MENSGITSLPVTGAGILAATAAASGQIILALIMASLCAFVTGVLMLRYTPEEEDL